MSKTIRKAMAFSAALEALRGTELLSSEALMAFSNLDTEQFAQWVAVWRDLPSERRVVVIEQMRDLAEDDIHADFTPLFRHALQDATERVRLVAIEGLEEYDHPDLIDQLTSLLRDDPSATARALAAQSLGRFVKAAEMGQISRERGKQVFDALIRVLRQAATGSLLHRRALEALAFSGHTEVDYHIRMAYYAEDDLLLLSALTAMGNSQNSSYRPLVRAELHNISPAVRCAAAIAAGELEDEEAVPDLIQLLEDPNTDVQLAALGALAHINHPQARQALEQAKGNSDPTIAQAAEDALNEWDFWHKEMDQFPMFIFEEEVPPTTRSRGSMHDEEPST